MNTLEIYDPAQCCATGACSPEGGDELAQFASTLEWLKTRGINVSRYNLGHQPEAFVRNPDIKGTISTDGIGCLPMIVADGKIVSKGRYPPREELARQLGLRGDAEVAIVGAPAKRCCG